MTMATVSEQAQRYLDEVRNGLGDVLSPDDIDEVIQDLEAHVVEIDPDKIEDELGSSTEFIDEFRASAGLNDPAQQDGRMLRALRGVGSVFTNLRDGLARILGPAVAPLVQRRAEISTAWVWSRGILALIALSFLAEYDTYGSQGWLLPKNGNLAVQLGLLALATFISVLLADAQGKWWQRLSLLASLGVGFVLLTAVFTTHYTPWPEETAAAVYGDDTYAEFFGPDQLIGPDGPVKNIYAYDAAGNPVQVLLYDQDGNPLATVPQQAFEVHDWEEFMWLNYEIEFVEDIHGRPIVNLYPLEQYRWTEYGARSAPLPPPIVGIPELATGD